MAQVLHLKVAPKSHQLAAAKQWFCISDCHQLVPWKISFFLFLLLFSEKQLVCFNKFSAVACRLNTQLPSGCPETSFQAALAEMVRKEKPVIFVWQWCGIAPYRTPWLSLFKADLQNQKPRGVLQPLKAGVSLHLCECVLASQSPSNINNSVNVNGREREDYETHREQSCLLYLIDSHS